MDGTPLNRNTRQWVIVLTRRIPMEGEKFRTRVYGIYTGKQAKHLCHHYRINHADEFIVRSVFIEDGTSLLETRENERAAELLE
jgi:hypothetical protein